MCHRIDSSVPILFQQLMTFLKLKFYTLIIFWFFVSLAELLAVQEHCKRLCTTNVCLHVQRILRTFSTQQQVEHAHDDRFRPEPLPRDWFDGISKSNAASVGKDVTANLELELFKYKWYCRIIYIGNKLWYLSWLDWQDPVKSIWGKWCHPLHRLELSIKQLPFRVKSNNNITHTPVLQHLFNEQMREVSAYPLLTRRRVKVGV